MDGVKLSMIVIATTKYIVLFEAWNFDVNIIYTCTILHNPGTTFVSFSYASISVD